MNQLTNAPSESEMLITIGKRTVFVSEWQPNKQRLHYRLVRNGEPFGMILSLTFRKIEILMRPANRGASAYHYDDETKNITWFKYDEGQIKKANVIKHWP